MVILQSLAFSLHDWTSDCRAATVQFIASNALQRTVPHSFSITSPYHPTQRPLAFNYVFTIRGSTDTGTTKKFLTNKTPTFWCWTFSKTSYRRDVISTTVRRACNGVINQTSTHSRAKCRSTHFDENFQRKWKPAN